MSTHSSGKAQGSESNSSLSNSSVDDSKDVSSRLESCCHIDDDDCDPGSADNSEKKAAEETISCWAIDEGYLRDIETDLTPEEKQRRKEDADRLKTEGNEHYKESKYKEAAESYTTALKTCPMSCVNERAILYSNRAACFLYMENKAEGIPDCTKALECNPNYLKALLRRALLYEETEKLDDALSDYRKVLEMEPHNPKALEASHRLLVEINERNEKLKTEMLGKLKDLGNLVLKPFGLSTDSFKIQQDPNTGSYSINMQK